MPTSVGSPYKAVIKPAELTPGSDATLSLEVQSY